MARTDNQRDDAHPTGEKIPKSSPREVVYPFGHYEIVVSVSDEGKFVGIVEVRVNKDFRDYKQKKESRGYHDVTDLYEE